MITGEVTLRPMDEDGEQIGGATATLEVDLPDPPEYNSVRGAWQEWAQEVLAPFLRHTPALAAAAYVEAEFGQVEPDEDGQVSGAAFNVEKPPVIATPLRWEGDDS